MHSYRGKFIVVEGGEGSGKTTILQRIVERLKSEGKEVLLTREPGGIPIAEQIRQVILDVNNTEMDAMTELLLYVAARKQHFEQKVVPSLEAGKIVLCDRFVHSSEVYQGYARNLGVDHVKSLHKVALGEFSADVTLWFDVDPEVGMARINRNADREVNRLDLEAMDFHRKVREGYRNLLSTEKNFYRVDANQSIEAVFSQAYRLINLIL